MNYCGKEDTCLRQLITCPKMLNLGSTLRNEIEENNFICSLSGGYNSRTVFGITTDTLDRIIFATTGFSCLI